MFRILHLSDIHIGKTYKEPKSIACKIAADIDYNGLSAVNCIIVTGDIFDGQIEVTESLICIAANFFESLLIEINSNQEKSQISKDDFIFVPGNHDLIRVDDPQKRWSKYRAFLEKFYGCIPSYYFENDYSLFREYREYKIAFVGFNSCEIEKRHLFDDKYISKFEKHIDESELNKRGIDKSKVIEVMRNENASEYDDYGYIPMEQITPIERKAKKLDNYIVVALFHHHFYLFPEVAQQFGDSGLIRNHTEVIQHLHHMNVSIVLHGHKHFDLERPLITDDYYECPDNIIDVFAGGSVGTDRIDKHTFGILDLFDKKDDIKLRHNKFVYNGENMEPIIKKQVPPQKLNGRVVKLLEILKTLYPEKHDFYEETAEKSFKSLDCCTHIISWVSEAITGFTEVSTYLEKDCNNVLFLLYAINFRAICYMKIVGKEDSYFDTISKTWKLFYETTLSKSDITIGKNEYHDLFMYKKLKETASHCDKILGECNDKKTQVYLAFTMLGMFFTDLYLVLTKYADDFKESIKYKVNIKIEENKFHENVPAPRIIVKSDADRRSAYIDLLCNDATAHKMAVLFIKEFDLLINKFEDYFKIIGLKLYYLLPRIDKDRMKNTLDNYNFEAYIPTLIPLLTGDNIYSSKVVFARELIQNSIDAISVREAKDEKDFPKKILIELKVDESGKRYFKIVDNGTGMDRFKIERYFTSIGRSFYSGEEYEDLNISYKPISNFGIGFLSSFMVCQEIDVKTKYYIDGSEGLKLHIPNYDGCFFIELDKETNIGTELKLYLNNFVNDDEIVKYIVKVMQDIKYPVEINYLKENGIEKRTIIPDRAIRRNNKSDEFKFFVPFFENGEVGKVDYEEDIVSNKYIEKYEYGLSIHRKKNLKKETGTLVLNSGIVVEQASLRSILGRNYKGGDYEYRSYEERAFNDIVANFPANWLQLDVARENITGMASIISEKYSKKGSGSLELEIANSLYCQLQQYIQYTKGRNTNIPAIYLQDVIYYTLDLCRNQRVEGGVYTKLLRLKYFLLVEFSSDDICYKIIRNGKNNERVRIIYCDENARKARELLIQNLKKKEGMGRYLFEQIEGKPITTSRSGEIISQLCYEIMRRIELKDENTSFARVDHIRRRINLLMDEELDDEIIIKMFTLLLLDAPDEMIFDPRRDNYSIISLLEKILLQKICIGTEETQEIRVAYKDLPKI